MGKYLVVILLMASMLSTASAQQQKPKVGIYLSNPLSLLSKERIKFEYRLNPANSLTASFAIYYLFAPGTQEALEYRHYFSTAKEKSENFLYGKLGGGNGTFLDFERGNINDGPGNYFLSGAGAGRHFNLGKNNHFFIDLATGLKFCITQRPVNTDGFGLFFYISGPGSIVDFNMHLGWQF